jgi:hypothetical protein
MLTVIRIEYQEVLERISELEANKEERVNVI